MEYNFSGEMSKWTWTTQLYFRYSMYTNTQYKIWWENGGRWGWSRWFFANCNICFESFISEVSQSSDLAFSTYHSLWRAKSNLAPTYLAVRTHITYIEVQKARIAPTSLTKQSFWFIVYHLFLSTMKMIKNLIYSLCGSKTHFHYFHIHN